MKQRTLAMMTGFEQYMRKTRRAIFLEEMEQVVPWGELCALVAPHYPQPGKGRRPVGVERMLRIYFLQQWFNLSDPAVEEALYDSVGMRQFVGIDLGCEPVPDETTVCKFRHLLEEHQLGEQILGQVNLHLQAQGVRITTGTIVDATILHAPTSTKNREQQRDPEMHQTKKGKQWYFGMKAHVGVDSKTTIIHTAVATAANVADSTVLPDLLHGEETRVWGDQAYRGQSAVIRACAPQAQDCTHRRYRYKDGVDEVERAKNRSKSTVRSKVEHVFAVMKLKFGCEATLSRTECHPTVRGGESVLGAEKTVALGTGLARERRLLITGEPPKQAEDRKKPNPSACTGLAEHLLPRRHGLIQSFPRSERRRLFCEAVLRRLGCKDIVSPETEIFRKEASDERKEFIALCLLRLLASAEAWCSDAPSFKAEAFKLFDTYFSRSLYGQLKIDSKRQSFEK